MGKTKRLKDRETQATGHSHQHLLKMLGFGLGVFIVVGAAALLLYRQFGGRVLPNVYVGGVPVGQMSVAQLRQVVTAEQRRMQVTFKDGAKTEVVPATQLGLTIHVDATVQRVMQARRAGSLLQAVGLWQRQDIPLDYSNDAGVLLEYVTSHFPEVTVPAQDAKLVFNSTSNKFDIQSGVPGKGFDVRLFESMLPGLTSDPRPVTLPLSTKAVPPIISDAALLKPQQTINDELALSMQFKYNGNVAYTLSPADIANWVHFPPDTTKGTVSVEYDSAKVQQFLTDIVGGKITRLPTDRKVVIDTVSGSQNVIQQGSPGYQLKDIDTLTGSVISALQSHRPLTTDLTVEQAPFKTVTVSGAGKWIEVDLSRETTTLYVGNIPVQTFLISSGMARTPTEIGTFHVYSKLPVTTMTGTILGEYYYIPNIKWVSYFDGGEAFHGTYWHHNFGHPMSHGCINMTEADAKVLYDFAPVGTKVVVHA